MCRRTRLLMFILHRLCECCSLFAEQKYNYFCFHTSFANIFCNFAQNYAYCTNKAKGISYFVREFTYNDE